MPVREALQALEGEGLITILPHKGATVLSLDAKRVSDIYDLRGAVESLLVRRSLPNLTNAAMRQLGEIHRDLAAAVKAEDSETVFSLNTTFHSTINRHAENPEACAVYGRYVNILGSLRAHYGFSQFRMRQMEKEHEKLLKLLRDQDEAKLDDLIRVHVEGAKLDLISRMEAAMPAATGTG
jgi:DNA-binding GntR family transcriptional regulator